MTHIYILPRERERVRESERVRRELPASWEITNRRRLYLNYCNYNRIDYNQRFKVKETNYSQTWVRDKLGKRENSIIEDNPQFPNFDLSETSMSEKQQSP